MVISIIALLVSILLPSMAKAKELARSIGCSANQRGLARATATYATSNRDWMNPLEDYRYPGGVKVETTFRVILWKYVGESPRVFDCPSELSSVYADGLSSTDIAFGNLTVPAGTDAPHLYGVLHPLERWNASGIGVAGVHWIRKSDPSWELRGSPLPLGRPRESGYREGLNRYSDIQTPAQLIFYGDGGSSTATLWADDNWWIKSTASGFAQGEPGFNRILQNDYGCRRHDGSANYAFADGHVQKLNANDIPCDTGRCWWSMRPNAHAQ